MSIKKITRVGRKGGQSAIVHLGLDKGLNHDLPLLNLKFSFALGSLEGVCDHEDVLRAGLCEDSREIQGISVVS